MPIKLTLDSAQATTSTVTIQITNGAFELLGPHPLRVKGTFTITGMSIGTHTVSLNMDSGATFDGTIEIPVTADAGAMPTVQINNVNANTVYLEWPTTDSETRQELTPGTAMAMANFAPDTPTSPPPSKS